MQGFCHLRKNFEFDVTSPCKRERETKIRVSPRKRERERKKIEEEKERGGRSLPVRSAAAFHAAADRPHPSCRSAAAPDRRRFAFSGRYRFLSVLQFFSPFRRLFRLQSTRDAVTTPGDPFRAASSPRRRSRSPELRIAAAGTLIAKRKEIADSR